GKAEQTERDDASGNVGDDHETTSWAVMLCNSGTECQGDGSGYDYTYFVGEAMANPEAFQKNIEALRAAILELRAVLIGSTEGLSIAHLDRGWRRSRSSGGDG